VGPEGLPNSKKISSLTLCGTKIPFYKNQWLSKAAVPLFLAVSGPAKMSHFHRAGIPVKQIEEKKMKKQRVLFVTDDCNKWEFAGSGGNFRECPLIQGLARD